MATTRAGVVLRHIRGLTDPDGRHPDPELLRRFAAARDEEAFAALVRRHGPMVWGVCRRVLGDWQEAEDAFQAAFLALARFAGSVRRGESLAGWLYGVAYRVALKARQRSQRMQRGEEALGGRAARPGPSDPLEEVSGREFLAVLDEELQSLSERYRAPLVLCYLQEKTCDEAAPQLGVSVSTLKRRLEQGRQHLRRRLQRRGLGLPAALLAAGLGGAAGAAEVPPELLAAATRLALQGPAAAASPGAAALAGAALRGMALARARAAAVLLALGTAALATSLLAYQALAGAGEEAPAGPPTAQPQAPAEPAPPPAAKPAAPRGERMQVSGKVLDPSGKPVKGAAVAVIARSRAPLRGGDLSAERHDVLGRAAVKEDGAFRLDVPRTSSARYWDLFLLAGAPGFGLEVKSLGPDNESPGASVRLAPEHPVKGRLVDLQGTPAAGVKLYVTWLGKWGSGNGEGPRFWTEPKDLPLWPAPVTTDKDGRFVLRGLVRGQFAQVTVRDDRFALQYLHTGTGSPGDELNQSLQPAQTLVGEIVCADTGKPVPYARLTVYAREDQYRGEGGMDAKADAGGRFRIIPLPGKFFDVTAYPPDSSPYLILQKKVAWQTGKVEQRVRLEVPCGVLLSGRVAEAGTGKPVPGASLQYVPLPGGKNPPPKGLVSGWQGMALSGADGTFRVAVPAGRGHLLVCGPTLDYVRQALGANEVYSGKPGGLRYYPHASYKYDATRGEAVKDIAVALRPGKTVRGRVLGPDGKPVARALMLCRLNVAPFDLMWRFPVDVHDGYFEVPGCADDETVPVYFLDPVNKWGAAVKVSAKQAGKPLTVRLEPCGKAVVRLVDGEGKPLARFRPMLDVVLTPGCHRYDMEALGRGELAADSEFVANIDRRNFRGGPHTDAEGRCAFDPLIPGATYRLNGFVKGRHAAGPGFTVRPGETLELPAVTIDRRE